MRVRLVNVRFSRCFENVPARVSEAIARDAAGLHLNPAYSRWSRELLICANERVKKGLFYAFFMESPSFLLQTCDHQERLKDLFDNLFSARWSFEYRLRMILNVMDRINDCGDARLASVFLKRLECFAGNGNWALGPTFKPDIGPYHYYYHMDLDNNDQEEVMFTEPWFYSVTKFYEDITRTFQRFYRRCIQSRELGGISMKRLHGLMDLARFVLNPNHLLILSLMVFHDFVCLLPHLPTEPDVRWINRFLDHLPIFQTISNTIMRNNMLSMPWLIYRSFQIAFMSRNEHIIRFVFDRLQGCLDDYSIDIDFSINKVPLASLLAQDLESSETFHARLVDKDIMARLRSTALRESAQLQHSFVLMVGLQPLISLFVPIGIMLNLEHRFNFNIWNTALPLLFSLIYVQLNLNYYYLCLITLCKVAFSESGFSLASPIRILIRRLRLMSRDSLYAFHFRILFSVSFFLILGRHLFFHNDTQLLLIALSAASFALSLVLEFLMDISSGSQETIARDPFSPATVGSDLEQDWKFHFAPHL